jgi:phage gp36-like protein
MANWASYTDVLSRADARVLSQLVSDSGERDVDFANNTRMSMALATATGEMKAHILVGNRYTVLDIESLTGESLEFRKEICCILAIWILWRSKPWLEHNSEAQRAAREDAQAYLELLKSGSAVFDIDSHVESGKPKIVSVPKVVVHTEWELFVDKARGGGRFYPRRRSLRNS